MWFVQNAVPGATRGRRRGFVVRVGGGLIRGWRCESVRRVWFRSGQVLRFGRTSRSGR